MPQVDDYSDDEEKPLQVGGGGRPAGGGGASTAQQSPQQESTFTPWSRFVSANADVAQREAGKLNSQVQGEIAGAKGDAASATKGFEDNLEAQYEHKKLPGRMDYIDEAKQRAFGRPANAVEQAQAFSSSFGQKSAPYVHQQQEAANLGPTADNHKMTPHVMETRTGAKEGAKAGPSSLEASMGADPWAKLVGDTSKAEGDAAALGSQGGLEALVQKNNQTPNSAFDAALIGGAGRQAFGQTAKQGDGLLDNLGAANQGAQGAWHQLMGDIDKAAFERKATDEADATNAANAAAGGGRLGGLMKDRGRDAGSGWTPTDGSGASYTDLNSFLHPDVNDTHDFNEELHGGGLALSPADWLTRGLGEAGVYQGGNATELFAGQYAQAGMKDDWGRANVRTALSQVQSEYGAAAAEYLWKHMTPEMWAKYMSENSGASTAEMRAWLESAGFKKQARDASLTAEKGTNKGASNVSQAGYTSGESDQGTTAEEETARNQAYAEGWGSSYDEQFRNGNRKPVKP